MLGQNKNKDILKHIKSSRTNSYVPFLNSLEGIYTSLSEKIHEGRMWDSENEFQPRKKQLITMSEDSLEWLLNSSFESFKFWLEQE